MNYDHEDQYVMRIMDLLRDFEKSGRFAVTDMCLKHQISCSIGTVLRRMGYLKKAPNRKWRWAGPAIDRNFALTITGKVRQYHSQMDDDLRRRRGVEEKQPRIRSRSGKETDTPEPQERMPPMVPPPPPSVKRLLDTLPKHRVATTVRRTILWGLYSWTKTTER